MVVLAPGHAKRVPLKQLRAALDIGEEERDRA
jgi:hypothetical protein